MGTNGDSSGLDEHRRLGEPHPRDPDYAPVKSPYVPAWLPWRLHREFLVRFHASVIRALSRRGGRWRNHRDKVRTTFHILGGLASAYKYGRVSPAWGRSMRGKKGQKALQWKLAMQGGMVVEHFATIGRQGGLAKAQKRREAYVSTLPPEQRLIYEHRQDVFSGRQRTRPLKS